MRVSLLSAALNALRFGQWYAEVTGGVSGEGPRGSVSGQDPWTAFDAATRAAVNTSGALRVACDLFLLRRAVAPEQARSVLGTPCVAWLEGQGILVPDADNRFVAQLCLLAPFDHYLFVDWPLQTPSRLCCQRTYLSSGSYDCIRFVRESGPVARAIDFGCGTGIVSLALAQTARRVTALDVDERAVWLTQTNLFANGYEGEVLHESWNNLKCPRERIDLAIANPPWRIVPPGIAYPDPLARMGSHPAGLGKIIEILKLLPTVLAHGGRAGIRFDLPLTGHSRCAYLDAQQILGPEFSFELQVLGTVSAQAQSQISADVCAHLNIDVKDLPGRFLEYYRSLGVSELQQVVGVITRCTDTTSAETHPTKPDSSSHPWK